MADSRQKKTGRRAKPKGCGKNHEGERSYEALLESERRYKQLVEVASDWFWETDADGHLTYMSPNVEPILGLPVSAYIGKRLAETEGIAYDPEAGRATLVAFKARRPYRDFIYSRKLRGGKVVWINSSGGPFYAEDGRFLGYRGVARDVTSQIEAERRLKTVEQQHRRLFETSSDWYWEQDVHGRLTYISPSFEDATGIPAEKMLGKRLGDVSQVKIDPESGLRTLAAIKNRLPYRDLVHEANLDDGRVVHVLTSGIPIYDENGEFRGYCGLSKEITAQVKAEHALRDSEQRFRELFEIASDYFWEADTHQRITYLSENYESVFGIPRSETLGKRLTETPGVSVDPEMGKMTVTAIKARRPYRDFLYSRKFADGKTRWFKTSGVPILGTDGTFLGYRGVGADMTAYVEAEQAARLARARLHDAVAHVTQPFVFYDAQDRATGFNQAFTDLHREPGGTAPVTQGISFHELAEWQLRVDFYAAAPDEEKVTLDMLFDRYEKGGEHSYHLRDGRWMLVLYRQLPGGGRVGLWTDVTAIKHAEQALRDSEQHFKQLCETAYDYFWETDPEGRITFLSPNFEGIFGISVARLQGRRIVELPGFGMAPESQKAILAAVLAKQPYRDLVFTVKWTDGPEHWVRVSAVPFFRDGEFRGYRGVGTDITAVKRAEAERQMLEGQLHHAQRLESLGTLAGGVAHEINNALVPVIALTKMVAAKLPEGTRERRNLDTVVGAAERSRDLVKQILAFSRKEESGQRLESVDLAAVLREALGLMRATVPTSIRLAEEITPSPPVAADPKQLHQVIVNLVANAAQAIGDAHGTITIGLRAEPDSATLRLWVADTGCGMDETTRKRVFEPFFTTKDVGKGTGLGLSVVHGIVKDHGGTIEVASVPGHGTRFDILLPLGPARARLRSV